MRAVGWIVLFRVPHQFNRSPLHLPPPAQYPHGESNPGFRTENPTSWATRRWGRLDNGPLIEHPVPNPRLQGESVKSCSYKNG